MLQKKSYLYIFLEIMLENILKIQSGGCIQDGGENFIFPKS
jgi:uncharacterized membrane protein